MPHTINVLAEVDTAEVSLVPQGANRRKRFAMLKAEDPMNVEKIMKAVLEIEAENEGELEKLAKEGKLSAKAVEAIKGMLRIAQAFKEELPEDAIKMLAKLAQMPGEEDEEQPNPDENQPPQPPKPEGGLNKDQEPKPEETTMSKDNQNNDTLDLDKIPEQLRPTIELMQKAAKESDATIAELRKSLDGEVEKRIEREVRELVEKEAPNAPGAQKDEIIALLKKTTDTKDRETLLNILRAASKAVTESDLLKQHSESPDDSSDSAWAEINKLAKARVEKSTTGLDLAHAISDVMADPANADLYNRYLAENNQG